jgi:hypothetical protein
MYYKSICILYALLCGQNFILVKSGCYRNTWLYSRMWCPGVLPLVKLHALHGSVVPIGVIVMLGLCIPPRRGCGEPAKPGLLYLVVV